MPATPQRLEFTPKDFEERASYDDLEEGDHIGTLTDVQDAVASTGNIGWKFIFDVKGLPVNTTVWLRGGGKWRVREIFNSLGQPVSPDQPVTDLDPNPLIGNQCVVTIKKVLRDETSPEEGTWTNISRTTPYVSEPVADFSEL